MKSFIKSITVTGLLLLFAQVNSNAQVEVGVGALYGFAPDLTYIDNNEQSSTGSSLSAFISLELFDQVTGRLQYTHVLMGTLNNTFGSKLNWARSFGGSIGYVVLGKEEGRIEFPIMVSGGVALVEWTSSVVDASPQIGGTVGAHVKLTEKVYFVAEGRMLRGWSVGIGGIIHELAFYTGIRATF